MNVWELSVPPCILCILLLFCLLYLSLLFSLFFWNELSWKLIKNVYLNRGPNKLMLQCPSLLHQMYMLFINWMYFICDNKLCWTWTWTCWTLPRFLEATKGIMFSDTINDLSGQKIDREGIDNDQQSNNVSHWLGANLESALKIKALGRRTSYFCFQLRYPRIWCCHYLPPGSLITLGASEYLSYSHVSFNLI